MKVRSSTGGRVTDEVTLPLYRKHDLLMDDHDTVIYTRVTDEECVSITRSRGYRDHDLRYEIEIRSGEMAFSSRSEREYNLGLGQYACTEQEFYEVVHEMKTKVAEVLHPKGDK